MPQSVMSSRDYRCCTIRSILNMVPRLTLRLNGACALFACPKIHAEAHEEKKMQRDIGKNTCAHKLLVLLGMDPAGDPANEHNHRALSPLEVVRLEAGLLAGPALLAGPVRANTAAADTKGLATFFVSTLKSQHDWTSETGNGSGRQVRTTHASATTRALASFSTWSFPWPLPRRGGSTTR